MELAKRMDRLGTETAFEVLAKAKELERQGRSVIHLEIGEPDFDTPRAIVQEGVHALESGDTHYSPSAGIEPLRRAIAEDQSARKGLRAEPTNVVVTPGAKPIIFYTMAALLEPGDEVIYPNPGFPIYESLVDYHGATRIPVGYQERDGRFVWDVDQAVSRMSPGTKLMILNSPSNPTGGLIESDDLQRLAEAAVANDVYVLSDEVYSRILYEGTFQSIATFPGMADRTTVLDGFSKTYAMT
ncbi:MAG: pyridoxal phosphate-dependent aminotransferase, partial [Chloroflexota bacterium]